MSWLRVTDGGVRRAGSRPFVRVDHFLSPRVTRLLNRYNGASRTSGLARGLLIIECSLRFNVAVVSCADKLSERRRRLRDERNYRTRFALHPFRPPSPPPPRLLPGGVAPVRIEAPTSATNDNCYGGGVGGGRRLLFCGTVRAR